ncbi:ABC transporter substrate-binding protein [Arthrobacter globiformis NBRC 12137]|jgi:multiple sugar transport system substrate-binding protein|uniref:ABC transporter substrate-binding protein n=1 Tax=Arthrobacter globiformis (strain ATCC 8010 / DSM 20124 / JCM 1332 / NBRC 12137 / NCIMB 8907 / NRRL B-2979 / 168) TaxID=1077972 RepID=H0QGX6_ARTG1|nr:ABC transporter substrate-binding protein [Arthrobacter globiformis]GAB12077.1 ABC transporter substrate-binding protein [Arthrobacter globiformis NBRC 12137]
MISRRNFLTAVAAGTVSAAALAACGAPAGQTGSAENPVTITYTWWGNDDRAERTRKAIALFEKKNPDVKVNGNFTDFAGYWQKRATEAAGGGLPDVMQWDLSYLRDYAQRNQLLDLGTVKINTDAFDKTLLPSGQIRGKTYGIPTSTNAFAVYYDPAKLKEIGVAEPAGTWTYAEYKDWLTKIGQAGGGKYFGASDFTGIWWQFNIWLRQKGIDAFTGDGKLGFSKDDLRTWLNLNSDLRGTNAVVPADRSAQVKPKSPFGSNLTVSENTWDNFMAGYLKDSGAKELKLVPVPSDDPDNLGLFLKPSMLMVASAKTRNKDAAARFIDFMVNDPEVGNIFKTSRGVPASKTQRDGTTFEGTDKAVVDYETSIGKYLRDAPEPPIVGFGTLEAAFLRFNEDLNYGKLTVDGAVDQWFKEAEDVIKQNA